MIARPDPDLREQKWEPWILYMLDAVEKCMR